ncbi:MAG: hypothetical protein GY953_29035, partial [bacterium]|nr:hypothetical protein [bacterium]
AALSQANGCSLDYNLTDQSLWLRADDGLNWLGPLPLGSAETLANSQCTVALSSAEGSDATLTLTVSITFAVEFPGVKSIYLYAEDSTGRNSGWRQLGMWNQRPAHAPEGLSVSPMSGSGSVGGFRFHFSDQDGYDQMRWTYVLFHSGVNSAGGCYIQYNHDSRLLWLMNDTGTQWTGPVVPGLPGTLSNSQCTVDSAYSSAIGAANTLNLGLLVRFDPDFAGLKNVYMYAADTTGENTSWHKAGTWEVTR